MHQTISIWFLLFSQKCVMIMNLKNVILRSQSETATYYTVTFILTIQHCQIHKDRKWISGFLGLEERGDGK